MKLTRNLSFPTSIAVGSDGIYVAESGLNFEGESRGGKVSRVNSDGSLTLLAGDLRPPVNGITWFNDSLIISEGGRPGRISRLYLKTGVLRVILDGLPGHGDYQTNMAVVGPDGKIYFSQGALTNSGVVGIDSRDIAWLRTVPQETDAPGYDVTLAGINFETLNPFSDQGQTARTGAFARFGEETTKGRRFVGRVPCTAGVMRCNPDGSCLEVVAWGLRNAYGLRFLSDGRLLATDQGADARGSRPIWNCPDFLYEIRQGAWYGWPDFFGGEPVTAKRFAGPDGARQQFVLANHAELPKPPRPLLEFAVNSCPVKFVELSEHYKGDLLVALFGDERPFTGPAGERVGRTLVRVSLRDETVRPAPPLGLQRPIDLAVDESDNLYVVDFGEFEIMPDKRVAASPGTGSIWKFSLAVLHDPSEQPVSFEKDIRPVFEQFRGSMLWRFDLTKYGHVKANAAAIYAMISSNQMPPRPHPPLTKQQVNNFQRWITSGYQP
jgi:glucose/arabinose dehydrogenase